VLIVADRSGFGISIHHHDIVAPPDILGLFSFSVNLSDGAIPQDFLHSHREAQRGKHSPPFSAVKIGCCATLLENTYQGQPYPAVYTHGLQVARQQRFASTHCMCTPARPWHQPRIPQFDPHRPSDDGDMMYRKLRWPCKSIITSPKGLTARGVSDETDRCLIIVAAGEKCDESAALEMSDARGGCWDLIPPAPSYICRCCDSVLPGSPAREAHITTN
jgi:hypothetical protein